LEPSTEQSILQKGSTIFATLCAPCHRADGGGLVGPNLTDDYWIHGPSFQDNVKTVINGVPEKGMLSWRSTLKPEEIKAVCSFIYTLRGTKPVNPKLPENQAPAEQKPSQFE
jgi:cytochrome c oxidase cbb3-type subunit III